MKTIDRLDEYIRTKNLNDNKVTEMCGLSKGYLYKVRKRDIDLGNDAKDRILATYSDLNRVWFLTGEGSMLLQSEHSKTDSTNNNNEEVEYWRERCKDAEAEVLRLKGQIQGLEMALRIIKGDVPSLKKRCRIIPLRR